MRSCGLRIHGDLEGKKNWTSRTSSWAREGFVVARARFPRVACASFSAFRNKYPRGAGYFPFWAEG
jgi:hypothetical protein